MYYIVYETTNLINAKRYRGKHIAPTLADNYLGSGTVFNRALKKYGKENFVRHNLFVFDNEDEMETKEKELVTIVEVLSSEFYNVSPGGTGGCIAFFPENPDYENLKARMSETQKAQGSEISKRQKLYWQNNPHPKLGTTQTERQKKAASEAMKGKPKRPESIEKQRRSLLQTLNDPAYVHPNTGKVNDEETRKKISENHADVNGANNPQYGKCWWNNGAVNLSLPKGDLPPLGYKKGMLQKKRK